ncbi:hypothetical protein [Falsirhodobacter xinxiangensis]|uniref:hypothetical protein n=1 Tax=Falsirhodobacter xinxiangensis TaxID=2530049 RepID=UPI001FE42668|nr:hypothetical protein [Rhodobacter xinxiangensis]
MSLLKIEVAAQQIGVPKASLRSAAEKHGFLVRMGRAIRIEQSRLPELIEACQCAPKAPVSTGTKPAASGSSETVADQKLQQAQQTVQRLKDGLRNTSRGGMGQPSARVTHLRS